MWKRDPMELLEIFRVIHICVMFLVQLEIDILLMLAARIQFDFQRSDTVTNHRPNIVLQGLKYKWKLIFSVVKYKL